MDVKTMPMRIAILEDNEEREAAMRSCLTNRFRQFEVCFFTSAPALIDYLTDHLSETIVVSLDHDLELIPGELGQMIDPGTGRDVAEYLAQQSPVCPVVIHTSNSTAALGMEMVLQEANWETHRVLPIDDLKWISDHWFRTIRRAIVGPTVTSAGLRQPKV
jgi:hypothetical protein